MANLITTGLDWMAKRIASYMNDTMNMEYGILESYYSGNHRPQLRVKMGQQDDNITQNYLGLAVDRSVSRLLRGGVMFVLPEGAENQQAYIDKVWELNKINILLYQAALHGTVFGTAYLKILPDELQDPYDDTGMLYPKLVPLFPGWVRMKSDPQDADKIIEYVVSYKVTDEGKEVVYRETSTLNGDGWDILMEKRVGWGNWETLSNARWAHDFAPIVHWKNLPSMNSMYGDSDIDDAVNIQDKSNFVASNTGKIIKFHASPTTILSGVSADKVKPVDNAPNAMYAISDPNGKAYNLEMSSELASSRLFGLDLRQSIFDITREVDISSISDKIGALTNFGLRVLWSDALDKNATKRTLYGDAFAEVNRRLLSLTGLTGSATNPGVVKFGEAIVVNVLEEMLVDEKALSLGIVDKQTIAEKYQDRYKLSWEELQERKQESQEPDNNLAETTEPNEVG
jgi:hypothetical protein